MWCDLNRGSHFYSTPFRCKKWRVKTRNHLTRTMKHYGASRQKWQSAITTGATIRVELFTFRAVWVITQVIPFGWFMLSTLTAHTLTRRAHRMVATPRRRPRQTRRKPSWTSSSQWCRRAHCPRCVRAVSFHFAILMIMPNCLINLFTAYKRMHSYAARYIQCSV